MKNNKEKIETAKLYFYKANPIIKNLPILQVTYENLFQKTTDIKKVEDYLGIKYNQTMYERFPLGDKLRKSFL